MFRLGVGLVMVTLVACGGEPLNGAAHPGWVEGADGAATARDAGDRSGPDGAGATDAEAGACLQPSIDPALARFQVGIVGAWTGTAIAPSGWTWTNATVAFTFDCRDHYQSRCLAVNEGLDADCVALYYGTDEDSLEKTYAVTDVRADGKATGEIDVYFFPGDTTHDLLTNVDLEVAGARLSFDLIHLDKYGPVHYDLIRQ